MEGEDKGLGRDGERVHEYCVLEDLEHGGKERREGDMIPIFRIQMLQHTSRFGAVQ